MILFDLHCGEQHRFEAWFRSGSSYDELQAAGAIACPECGSTDISKAPMALHIATSADDQRKRLRATHEERTLRDALETLQTHVERSCDYVGDAFAEEARRIHYGETQARNIYGEASEGEARKLKTEGIEFHRIPWLPPRD